MPDTIEIEIPEWVKDNNIYIMAGMNLLAYRYRGGLLMVKTQQCSMCGNCCMNLDEKHPFSDPQKACQYLEKEVGDNQHWLCGLGAMRPHGCAVAHSTYKNCTVRYEERV